MSSQSKSTYWKVTDNTVFIAVDSYRKTRQRGIRDANKLCREVGANRCVFYESFFNDRLGGFVFDDESGVDQTLFKRARRGNQPLDHWQPRLSGKEGKELAKRMHAIDFGSIGALCKAIGMEQWKGNSLRSPGFQFIGKDCYLVVPDDVKPKGCVRVSDVEFEAAVDSQKKANPKKAGKSKRNGKHTKA